MRKIMSANIFIILALTIQVSGAQAVGLLVNSSANSRVLEFDRNTGAFVGQFVTAGSGGLDKPDDLTYGPDGNLYVLDFGQAMVFRYDGVNGDFIDVFVTSMASGDGVTFGPDGNFYAYDGAMDRINRFNGTTGEFIDTFVDTEISGGSQMIFREDGNLLAGDFPGDSINLYNGTTGDFIEEFVPSMSGGLDAPFGFCIGPDGDLYVGSYNTDQVLRYDGTTGDFLEVFASNADSTLNGPSGCAFGPDGNFYVVSLESNEVLRFDGTTGDFIDAFVTAGSGGLDEPFFLVFAPEGNLEFSSGNYTADEGDGTATITVVRQEASNGQVSINYATSDGTAQAGVDYETASGTLVFNEGETSKEFTVNILDNNQNVGSRTVNLTLSDPAGGAELGNIVAAVLTISENDPEGGGCHLMTGIHGSPAGTALILLGLFGLLLMGRRKISVK